jgi:Putative regulator of cell autolysis
MNINIHPSKRLQSYVDHVIHMGLMGLFKYDTFTFYFLDFIYFISLPLGIKLTKSILSIGNEKSLLEYKNLELELSNVQLELAFLKSQINPHFLFNTINNIIFLVSEDTVLAEKSLAQLSRIMNYLVYESDKKTVPLDSEISFLKSYIELEKMRLSSKVKTTIDINTDSEKYTIVPLIIFPFVENAFKHGPMTSSRNAWVDIQILIKNHILNMKVSNGFRRIEKPPGYVGGIGVENVYKRLELNYPDQYKLTINESGDSYTILLKLSLNANEFSDINL